MKFYGLSLLIVLSIHNNLTQAQAVAVPKYSNTSLDFETRAADLVSRMTLEEKISQNEFYFSARLEVDYLNEEYDLNIPKSEAYETLGGFIIEHLESIPKESEIVNIDNFEIRVLQVSSAKIEEVSLKIINEDA